MVHTELHEGHGGTFNQPRVKSHGSMMNVLAWVVGQSGLSSERRESVQKVTPPEHKEAMRRPPEPSPSERTSVQTPEQESGVCCDNVLQWVSIKRGDPIPQTAVEAGTTRTDGTVYVGRFGGLAGKINKEDGKMWNFW